MRAFKAISAGVLSPLAVIFALLVGFLAAQAWNDGDRAPWRREPGGERAARRRPPLGRVPGRAGDTHQ